MAVTTDEADSGNARSEAADPHSSTDSSPMPLEYYSPATEEESRPRRLTIWSILLLLGWLPYSCGIINASTVAVSYNAAITRAHEGGAVVFMGAGIMLSVISLAGFARVRHLWGITAAATVLLVQLAIAACIGLAR
jgi:hypothetical protein